MQKLNGRKAHDSYKELKVQKFWSVSGECEAEARPWRA